MSFLTREEWLRLAAVVYPCHRDAEITSAEMMKLDNALRNHEGAPEEEPADTSEEEFGLPPRNKGGRPRRKAT